MYKLMDTLNDLIRWCASQMEVIVLPQFAGFKKLENSPINDKKRKLDRIDMYKYLQNQKKSKQIPDEFVAWKFKIKKNPKKG